MRFLAAYFLVVPFKLHLRYALVPLEQQAATTDIDEPQAGVMGVWGYCWLTRNLSRLRHKPQEIASLPRVPSRACSMGLRLAGVGSCHLSF